VVNVIKNLPLLSVPDESDYRVATGGYASGARLRTTGNGHESLNGGLVEPSGEGWL